MRYLALLAIWLALPLVASAADVRPNPANITGNAATATALAADPADCSAGTVAMGINASGTAVCTATPSVTSLQGIIGNVTPLAGLFTTLGVGTGTTAPVTEVQAVSTVTSSPRGIMSSQYNTGTDGARFHGRKARGTFGTPTTIVSGDNLTRWVGSGYDGTAYLEMASIIFGTEGTIGTNRVPTNIVFQTATDAATSVLTTRLTIDSAGLSTFTGAVTLGGNLNLPNSNSIMVSGGVAPQVNFQNSATTSGSDAIALYAAANHTNTSASTDLIRLGFASVSGFSPASGSGSWAGVHINHAINGTSSGTAYGLLLASKTNTLTGGTIKLASFGTTTTDGFTGYTPKFSIDTAGMQQEAGVLFANLGTPSVGAKVYCTDCDAPAAGIMATCTSAGTKTGAWAFRVNTTPVWGCIGI